MELIVINSSKLKIMLSDDDMKKYELDAEAIDYDTTATRRAFWSILDDAKTETGFNAASDKLLIQLYPSKKGGCEMYVTKMEEAKQSPPRGHAKPLPRDLLYGGHKRTEAYVFEALEHLLCVCRRLLSLGYEGESHAYRDHTGRFFLLLCRYCYGASSYPDEYAFITEFGKAENVSRVKLYITEHGECLRQNDAVMQLGRL